MKRSKKRSEAPAPDADLEPQGTLFWVQGQLPDGSWRGLYCYSSEREAKAAMRAILDMPEDGQTCGKEGLNTYEDFRVRLS